MNIKLILPNKDYKESFIKQVNEFINSKDAFFLDLPKYINYDKEKLQNDFENYIIKPAEDKKNGVNLPDGWVPATTFWLVDTDTNEILAYFNVRHSLTEHLIHFGGHIGYSVPPSKRGKGYTLLGLKLVLDYCNKELNIKEALLSVDARNEPSYRIIVKAIELFGGKFDTPIKLADGLNFNDNPYYPENKNNLGLRFWINTDINKDII